ncbi:hypothetical protein OESDEN_09160 [Oesophagostomum dentatum]|uniref:Uncharacterized protein n=1 Tax=Oesophagostomum dentatum TaxID=61180 RepID=A0A0B1T4A0_OESDE|nr:hypothetical protein OESDEN_09160 [Oesophagostomum dentatum]
MAKKIVPDCKQVRLLLLYEFGKQGAEKIRVALKEMIGIRLSYMWILIWKFAAPATSLCYSQWFNFKRINLIG